MSRIHDALKKAELEKAASLEPIAEPGTARADTPDLGLSLDDPVTFEALAARCPASAWKPATDLMLFADPEDKRPGAEEFRTLRSRLYQIREKQPLQTVLVASPLPGEGKTFASLNLAHAIVQQQGRSALLVDADLRDSGLGRLLGAASEPGLTEYLQGKADAWSILQHRSEDRLFFIAGGSRVPNPLELLSSGRLKTLLHRLAPVFDWIILDSPPAVPVSDASLLAQQCDGVLLVVQSGQTPYPMAQKARQEFQGKNVVGVVLNRVSVQEGYARYYYAYYGKSASKNGKLKTAK